MKLSPHFTKEEFEVDGCVMPEESIVQSYVALCQGLLEPIRQHYDLAMFITSGYRSADINKSIGGVSDSQHVASWKDCAADFYLDGYRKDMRPVFDWIRLESNLVFDQLILEHGKYGDVIHISASTTPRRMALEGATFNQTAYVAKDVAPLVKNA